MPAPGADKEFNENVPDELLRSIKNAGSNGLSSVINDYEDTSDQSWRNVFNKYADEAFMCWHYALHINKLAESAAVDDLIP